MYGKKPSGHPIQFTPMNGPKRTKKRNESEAQKSMTTKKRVIAARQKYKRNSNPEYIPRPEVVF